MKTAQFKRLVTTFLLVAAMAMPKMAWAEITPQQPSGNGTADSPYQIGTPEELYWFAALVNGKLTDVDQNTSACAVLVSDITVNNNLLNSLDEYGNPTGTVTIESWTPFGYYNSNTDKACYSGTFDGQGHSINGLYRKQPDEGKISFCGVIGGGTIKNVAIIDSYFEGKFDVGGITGLSYVSGTIINCLYHGIVKGNRMVGGICGAVYDITISDCFFNGEIRKFGDNQQYFGAICGYSANANHFKNCVYNKDLFDGYAIEDGTLESCTLTSVTGMTTEEIASGKATHWLNRYQFGDGSIGWHQNIDNGKTKDAYPVLDNTHGVVYTSQPCPSSGTFSNTKPSSSEVQHSWDTDNVCTKCGKTKDVFDLVEGFQEPSQVDGVYQISTKGELYWFTALVNGSGLLTDGTPPNNSANAVLTSDITVNSNVLDESGNLGGTSDTRLDWIPVGNSDRPYTGTFNGQGHTISGLYFNDSSKNYVGLFGELRKGKIQNTGIVDSYFNGKNNVGGLCGEYYNGSISYCYNTGAVSGNSYVGGLCGYAYNSSISYCYNTGAVSGSLYVGGLCGTTNTNSSGTISNCYFDNNKCNKDAVEGNVGTLTVINTSGKTTEEFASGEVCYLLNGSRSTGTTENPLVWYQNLSEGGDACPVLKRTGNNTVYLNNHYSCSCEPGNPTTCYTNDNQDIYDPHSWENGFCAKNSSVCQPAEQNTDGVYEISNAGQLYWYAKLINDNDNIYACAVLTNDITDNEGDVAGCNGAKKDTWRQWEVICNSSYYHGTFDGQCHTISGLFGYGFIGKNEGTIKNLIISNSYLFKYYSKGGICNENYGTISRCTFSGTLVGQADLMGATDKYYIGGICGLNQNIIEDCYVKDNIQFSTATPNSNNKLYVGGISGGNAVYGKIENCYNMANITCQTTVNTPFIKSGICGWNTDNAVTTNCYYLTGTADYGIGETVDVKGSVEAVSSEKFASGEVAYLLQSGQTADENGVTPEVWGQIIGTDPYPVLGGLPVYFRDEVYTNTYGILTIGTQTITASNAPLVWYEFTPSETGSYQFSSTQLTAGNLYVNTTRSESDYTNIATSPTYNLEAATTYYVAVSGAPGSYDLTITRINNTPTAIETVTTLQIYAVDGRIVCEGEFRIYDLLGRDVTRLNGSLSGVYVVKTTDAAQKVVVK